MILIFLKSLNINNLILLSYSILQETVVLVFQNHISLEWDNLPYKNPTFNYTTYIILYN